MRKKFSLIALSLSMMLTTFTLTSYANESELHENIVEDLVGKNNYEFEKELFTMPVEDAANSLMEDDNQKEYWVDPEKDIRELPKEIQEKTKEFKMEFSKKSLLNDKTPGSGFQDAAVGFSNQVVSQGFKEGETGHYYKLNMNAKEEYAFLLTNLSKDYDLYLSDGESVWGIPQTGTTSEQFYFRPPNSGTYYVVVLNKGEIASSNYFLYFGDYIRSGHLNHNPEISYNFGTYNPPGLDQYPKPPRKYSPQYLIDFANDSRVPGNSAITSLYIDDNSTGYWTGLYHELLLAQNPNNPIEKMAGIGSMISSSDNSAYMANQQMLIRSNVVKCDYFTWNPTIRMSYIYGMNIDNLWYMIYNGI